jgi:hypothetical protein
VLNDSIRIQIKLGETASCKAFLWKTRQHNNSALARTAVALNAAATDVCQTNQHPSASWFRTFFTKTRSQMEEYKADLEMTWPV